MFISIKAGLMQLKESAQMFITIARKGRAGGGLVMITLLSQ